MRFRGVLAILSAALVAACAGPAAPPAPLTPPAAPAEQQPLPGHPGKDVIWVPTPPSLVERMLDMAAVTKDDYVIDLGSGDGRVVIAAAKRGARAVGVEYTPELVAMARRNAADAGVAELATFVQGDMFEADISRATVLALFLLPANLERLKPQFRTLKPGTRIVNNGYRIPAWDEAQVGTAGDCGAWCTAYLYYVPADVAGAWRLGKDELTLRQDFQALTGRLHAGSGDRNVEGWVHGERIHLRAGLDQYDGRVQGARMSGEASGSVSGFWSAEREKASR
ncbi:MAG: methyltransferase domain-containing protein [Betaproteobacteria bacterium]|nr:methyltransferase domain-containing protein [Betaproteobacteria bacterium]